VARFQQVQFRPSPLSYGDARRTRYYAKEMLTDYRMGQTLGDVEDNYGFLDVLAEVGMGIAGIVHGAKQAKADREHELKMAKREKRIREEERKIAEIEAASIASTQGTTTTLGVMGIGSFFLLGMGALGIYAIKVKADKKARRAAR